MTVSSTGNVGIGTASPTYKLHVNGSVAGTGAYNALSDRRFKKDVHPLHESLRKILAMKGVSFHWKKEDFPDYNFSSGPDIGFIAQDVEEVFPEAVTTDSTGTKSVAYSKIVAPLVEATKELYAELTAMKIQDRGKDRKIASLEERNSRLEAEVSMMKKWICSKEPESEICR